jgi:hypothetical protein
MFISASPRQALHHAGDDAVAAIAGEAECVLAREVDLGGEALAQEAARAKEPRTHRRFGESARMLAVSSTEYSSTARSMNTAR